MSAELETILNDLIMRAERTAAEFRMEVANAKRVEEALARMKQLNAAAFNEALSLMQPQPLMGQAMPQALPAFHPTWN
jgi:hypothetical protein